LFVRISDAFFKSGKPGELASETETTSTDENDKQAEHCMVCGEALAYHEKSIDVSCNYCGRKEHGHITCPNKHYICDHCHNRDALSAIEDIVLFTDLVDSNEIAELAFSINGLPMLGCQHAYIAGGALMAALKNEGTTNVTNNDIKEVFNRTRKQAHGGYCGLTGVCGIAPAIGACFALLTGSKCGTDKEQRTTMEVVSRVTRAITELTGPSCCKAYVRAALEVAVEFLRTNLDISLPTDKKTICSFSAKHPHGCRESQCPYFMHLQD
jgi:hypothetical protein